jgi:ribonuclease III
VALAQTTDEFAGRLDHEFKHPELLQQALTHSSFANEHEQENGEALDDNEQFEFLGDAVLQLVSSEHLFRQFPDYGEGDLSKLRAHLVSTRHLSKVGKSLHIGQHLRLGNGEERTGGRTKQALLADAMEAVIAALYLDGGLPAARNFIVRTVIAPELERMGPDPAARTARIDYKSSLQELLQAEGRGQPSYEVVAESGPEHNKTFTVELRLEDMTQVQGQGRSKKSAEQKAAELALQRLRATSAKRNA